MFTGFVTADPANITTTILSDYTVQDGKATITLCGTYLLHIPRRDVLTGLFAVPWYAGEAALLASTSRKYMQNI